MSLSYFIARRYLFAKKSHNVINIISLISALGILVGSCALVIVMSVYNGFEEIVRGMYDQSAPDIVITSSRGKYFDCTDSVFAKITSHPSFESATYVVEETVFVNYDKEEGVATIKGVDDGFVKNPTVSFRMVEGVFALRHGEIAQTVVGRGLYSQMGISPRFLDPVEVYFPDASKEISVVNPMASLRREVFFPAGIFSSSDDKYNNYFYVPLESAQALLGLDSTEIGAMEIRVADGFSLSKVQKEFSAILADDFVVKDKYMQNETVYKMMKVERVVIYMILLFIIVVICCNVFGSLTMLIIEKRDDIMTLRNLGARDSLIRSIFFREGYMIIMLGTIIGMFLGIALSMVQQHFGVIEMPGNFVVNYYPVVIRWSDLILTFGSIAVIGLAMTLFPVRNTLSKIL